MLAEERQEVTDHRPGALREGGKRVVGLRVIHAAALTILHAFVAQGLKEKYDYDKVLKALKKGTCSAVLRSSLTSGTLRLSMRVLALTLCCLLLARTRSLQLQRHCRRGHRARQGSRSWSRADSLAPDAP